MRVLFLDDMKIRHEAYAKTHIGQDTVYVFTAKEAKDVLDNQPRFDRAQLDHDLAEEHYLELSEGLYESAQHSPTCLVSQGHVYACTCGAQEDAYKTKKLVGTGMDVVDHIVAMDPYKRPRYVIIHSYNERGAEMLRRLKDAGVPSVWIRFDPKSTF
jgi:GrpB-like predicted nucleotidyltransferase (UPF0157 family)